MDAANAVKAAQFQMQYATKVAGMAKDQQEAEGRMVNQLINSTPGAQSTASQGPTTSGQSIDVRV